MAEISDAHPAAVAQRKRRPLLRPRFSLAALFGVMTLCSAAAWYWYQVPFLVEQQKSVLYENEAGEFDESIPIEGREVFYVRRGWGRGQETRHGAWTLYDGRGEVRAEGRYRNGAKHGKFVDYYVSGAQQREENYESGALHGPTRRWNAAGNLVSEVHYSRGRRDGKFFQAHGDGRPSIEGAYHEDTPDNNWVWRPRFGGPDDPLHGRLTGAWQRGMPQGVWTLQDPDGEDVLTLRFLEGQLAAASRPVESRLAAMLARGDVEPDSVLTLLRTADCSFEGTRLDRVVELLRSKYEVQISLAGATAAMPVAHAPVTYEQCAVPLIVALGEILPPLGLVCEYRYGLWWITTAERVDDLDPTGIEALAPPQESELARAWKRPVVVDCVDMPSGDALEFLAMSSNFRYDSSRLPLTARAPVTVELYNVPLEDALRVLLHASGCRASLDGEVIIVELQEGHPLEESERSPLP